MIFCFCLLLLLFWECCFGIGGKCDGNYRYFYVVGGLKEVIPMATVSFDKNIVVKEPEAIERLVEVLSSSKEAKPINRKLASDEAMAIVYKKLGGVTNDT